MSRLTRYNEKGEILIKVMDYDKAFKKLAHYEDLEEAGRLIELPCKVGDKVWVAPLEFDETNGNLKIISGEKVFADKFEIADVEYFGSIIFLTKSEAEAKLAEMQPLPILHGNIAPNSKEEALERLGISPNNLAELKGGSEER